MNYFTPELLTRFGSPDDGVADAASREWERAQEAYVAHLSALRSDLPKSVRTVLRRFCLHDAKVLTIAIDEAPFFSIFLQLKNPRHPLDNYLELRYSLTGGPKHGLKFFKHASLEGDGKPFGWWLYDEIDVLTGEVSAFTHSILFTGGHELQLYFYGLRCRRLRKLLLPDASPALGEGALELLTA
jgi:hypothetical protein